MSSVARILDFIEFQGLKKSEFYLKTGLSNGYLDKVKEVGADKIATIISTYPQLNLKWLITGKGKMITDTPRPNDENYDKATAEVPITPVKKGGKVTESVTFPSRLDKKTPIYNLGLPHVITVDKGGKENISHVPVKARAGYLLGYGDQEFISHLDTYRLPGLKHGTFRSFEVEGMSMKPTLKDKDWVIGQWIESLDHIRENRIHIVVTRHSGILVKRVLNRISERNKLYLKSDSITNRLEYPTLELDPSEVVELWYARIKFSPDFSEPSEIYRRIDDLEIAVMELKKHSGK